MAMGAGGIQAVVDGTGTGVCGVGGSLEKKLKRRARFEPMYV